MQCLGWDPGLIPTFVLMLIPVITCWTGWEQRWFSRVGREMSSVAKRRVSRYAKYQTHILLCVNFVLLNMKFCINLCIMHVHMKCSLEWMLNYLLTSFYYRIEWEWWFWGFLIVPLCGWYAICQSVFIYLWQFQPAGVRLLYRVNLRSNWVVTPRHYFFLRQFTCL